MLLPGPEARQLAIYAGWLLHKIPGGVAAGAFFVIPGMSVLFSLSYVYSVHGNIAWAASIFSGLKPAVIAIVAAAVIRIAMKALGNSTMIALAAADTVWLKRQRHKMLIMFLADAPMKEDDPPVTEPRGRS
jgi:chromate transporter